MFTQAGVNLRGHMICRAFIGPARSDINYRRRAARLWLFRSGDVAWITSTFIAWPHQCRVENIIGRGIYVPAYLPEYASTLRSTL